ncbi:DNA repair protein RecO [Pacificimonas sp. ICDLI1SI03]
MHLTTTAIMLTARAHGEHGAVIRMLTETNGLIAAYVHGGRSRKSKPLLSAGNMVMAQLDSRGETQLATARIELMASRAALALHPLTLSLTEWLTMLVADVLPEGEAFAELFEALAACLALMEADADALQMGQALARFELKLLRDLGFRLDLDSCAATGDCDDLIYLSPKSGRAVSASAGAAYKTRLFALPAFMKDPAAATGGDDILAALRITRHFIERDLLPPHRAEKTLLARTRVDVQLQKRF